MKAEQYYSEIIASIFQMIDDNTSNGFYFDFDETDNDFVL